MKLIRRIWNNIRRGENIDLYVTVVAALVLATLNILGKASQTWVTSLTLALLALIAISLLVNRDRLERIAQTTEGVLKREWPKDELLENIKEAKDILLIGVSLSRTVRNNLPLFDKKLQQDASIRILLVAPTSPAAGIAASRLPAGVNIERTQLDIESTLKSLCNLQNKYPKLEIRTLNNPMTFGGNFLDASTSNGRIYLEYYSFKMSEENIPKLVFRPVDKYWYDYCSQQAELLWKNADNYSCRE